MTPLSSFALAVAFAPVKMHPMTFATRGRVLDVGEDKRVPGRSWGISAGAQGVTTWEV
jgi:hypothetical protein